MKNTLCLWVLWYHFGPGNPGVDKKDILILNLILFRGEVRYKYSNDITYLLVLSIMQRLKMDWCHQKWLIEGSMLDSQWGPRWCHLRSEWYPRENQEKE